MKEYAGNLYDIIENIAYDIDRYNRELTTNIPEFMAVEEHGWVSERMSSTISFIIHKSDDMVFDHILRTTMDILGILERKHRLVMTGIKEHSVFKYSKTAMEYMVFLCTDSDNSSSHIFHDIDPKETLSEHHQKMLKYLYNKKFNAILDCNQEEMETIFTECHSKLYNVVYAMYMKMYYNKSKDYAITSMKEIISCLISAATLLSTVVVVEK